MADDNRNLNNGISPNPNAFNRNNQTQPTEAPWASFAAKLDQILRFMQDGDKSTGYRGGSGKRITDILDSIDRFSDGIKSHGKVIESFSQELERVHKNIHGQLTATSEDIDRLDSELTKRKTLSAHEMILKRGELRLLKQRQESEKGAIAAADKALKALTSRAEELDIKRDSIDTLRPVLARETEQLRALQDLVQRYPQSESNRQLAKEKEAYVSSIAQKIEEYDLAVSAYKKDFDETVRGVSDEMRQYDIAFRDSIGHLRDSVSDVTSAFGVLTDATSSASGVLQSLPELEDRIKKSQYEKSLDAIEQNRKAVEKVLQAQDVLFVKLLKEIEAATDESVKAEKKAQLNQLKIDMARTKQQKKFFDSLTPMKDIWVGVGNQLKKVGFSAVNQMAQNVGNYFTKRFIDDTADAFNKVYQSIENTRNEISARLRLNQGDFSAIQGDIQDEIEAQGLQGVIAQSDVNDALVSLTTAGITDREFLKEMALESAKLKAEGVDIDLTNEETLERLQNLQGQGYTVQDLVKLMETAAGQMQATKTELGAGTAFIGGGGNTILNQVLDIGTAFGKNFEQLSDDIGSAIYSAQALKLGGSDPQMLLEKINTFVENPLGNQDVFTLAWAQRMGYVNETGTITADDIANMSYDEILSSMNDYIQEIFAEQDAMLVPYLKEVYGISTPTTQLLRMGQSEVEVKLPEDFSKTVADTMAETDVGLQNATWISETLEGQKTRENLMTEQAIQAEKFYNGDQLFNSVTSPIVNAIGEIKNILITGAGSMLTGAIGKWKFGKLAKGAGAELGDVGSVGGSAGSTIANAGRTAVQNLLPTELGGVGGADSKIFNVGSKLGAAAGFGIAGYNIISDLYDGGNLRTVLSDPEVYSGIAGGVASAVGGPIAGAVVGGITEVAGKFGNWLGDKLSEGNEFTYEDFIYRQFEDAADALIEAANTQLNAAEQDYTNAKNASVNDKRKALYEKDALSASEAQALSAEEINKKYEELILAEKEQILKEKQAQVKKANLMSSSTASLANLQVNLDALEGLSTERGSASTGVDATTGASIGGAGLSEQSYKVLQLLGTDTSEQLTSAIFDAMADGSDINNAFTQITEGMISEEAKDSVKLFVEEVAAQKEKYEEQNKEFQDKWKKAASAAGTDDVTMIALKYAEMYEDDIKKGSLPNMKTTGPSGSYQMDSSESIYIDTSGLPVLADAHGTYDPSAYVGRFKSGLTRVPSDNYVAVLHEGERVLTAQEAKAYNDLSSCAGER